MVKDVGASAVVIVIALGMMWRSWQLWGNRTRDLDMFSVRFLRAVPVMSAFMCAVVLTCVPFLVLARHRRPVEYTAPVVTFAVGFAVVLVVGVTLTALVFLTGRPERFVPPHLRVSARQSRDDLSVKERPR